VVGGITRANLEDTLDWWESTLGEFTDYIDWS
jgi:hypothetical protein